MTAQEIRVLMHQMAQATNSHDPTAVAAFYALDAVLESPSTGVQRGREEIERASEHWRTAFPDTTMVLEDVLVEGDRVAAYTIIRATQQGEFLGLPATGRQLEFRAVFLRRVADGLVVHERRIYDFHGFLIKLGVLKVKPAS